MAEFLESLVSVARIVVREEDQDNIYESNANENLKEQRETLNPYFLQQQGWYLARVKWPVVSIP